MKLAPGFLGVLVSAARDLARLAAEVNPPAVRLLAFGVRLGNAVILPTGYSMTVYGPNYRKTFTGGKKWSS